MRRKRVMRVREPSGSAAQGSVGAPAGGPLSVSAPTSSHRTSIQWSTRMTRHARTIVRTAAPGSGLLFRGAARLSVALTHNQTAARGSETAKSGIPHRDGLVRVASSDAITAASPNLLRRSAAAAHPRSTCLVACITSALRARPSEGIPQSTPLGSATGGFPCKNWVPGPGDSIPATQSARKRDLVVLIDGIMHRVGAPWQRASNGCQVCRAIRGHWLRPVRMPCSTLLHCAARVQSSR